MTKPRSRGTLAYTRWTALLQLWDLHRRTLDQEPRFPRPGIIMASPCPLPDLALELGRAIARFRDGWALQYFFLSLQTRFLKIVILVVICISLFIMLLSYRGGRKG